MSAILESLRQLVTPLLSGALTFIVALLILLAFYIVARIISGAIRRVLRRTNLDNRFADAIGGGRAFPIEDFAASIAFWVVMLFGVIAFLRYIQLEQVAGPLTNLLDQIFIYLPRLGGALLLAVLAWAIATIVKLVVTEGANRLQIDRYLNEWDEDRTPETSLAGSLGTALYWLVFLLFLPAILDKLGMQALVTPLQAMLSKLLTFLPNILSAVLILLIGLFVARVVRQIVVGLLGALGLDGYGRRAGLTLSLTTVIGSIVYTVIALLTITQALQALKIAAISDPATRMIEQIFGAVPGVVGAALVLAIAYIVGRLVAGLISGLLAGIGFDGVPARLGLRLGGQRTPSELVGYLIIIGFMLLAGLAATDLLGFRQLSVVVQTFVGFAGQLLIGLITLAIGLYLANLAADLARNAGMSRLVVTLVRSAVLVLVGAMALQAIGIGQSIVELAFGIGLGAIGIAAALAFGLGSREVAGREVERFVTALRSEDDTQD